MEKRNGYRFTIGGLMYADEDAKVLGKVEVYAEGEWIPLMTEIQRIGKEGVWLFMDCQQPDESITLWFDRFTELEKIQAVRITGMVVDKQRKDLLHIVRNTISLTFDRSECTEYGLAIRVRFPALFLEGDGFQELIDRNEESFLSYDESLFFSYTSGNMAELDEYKTTRPVSKTYVPLENARVVLEKQFDDISEIFDAFGIRRWNYMERKKSHLCKPVSDSKENQLLKIPII